MITDRGPGLLVLLLLVALAPVPAQAVIDVPLPAGLPLGFEGPGFTADGALAVAGEGAIHAWSGLPWAPAHLSVIPPGAEAMATPWEVLAADVALYVAVGADRVAGTGDDALVLVTGLPGTPTPVPTGITGEAPGFFRVNAHTAVRVDAATGSFRVLRWSGGGARRHVVPSPVPLAAGASSGFGRLSDDRIIGVGPGLDLVSGTADDHVVLLEGLAAGTTFTVTTLPVPGPPRGFRVSASGAGVLLQVPAALPAFRLTIYHDDGGALAVRSVEATSPASGPASIALTPGEGDAVVVACPEVATPLTWWTLVGPLGGATGVIGSWTTDAIDASHARVLAEDEVAFVNPGGTCPACHASWFALTRFAAGVEETVVLPLAGAREYAFLRPNRTSRVAFANRVHPSHEAALLLAGDPWVGPALAASDLPGQWTGNLGDPSPRVAVLGPGLVAGFVSSALPFGPPTPEVLRLVTVPAAEAVAPGWIGSGYPVPPVQLHLLPRVPRADQPITCVLTSIVAGSDHAVFAFALDLAGPLALGPPQFLAGSRLQLDPASLLLDAPVPVASGQASRVLDLTPLLPGIRGVPIFVQAALHSVSNPAGVPWFLSDAWLLCGG